MLIPDVNVLLYAHRQDLELHADATTWMAGAMGGREAVGLCDHVLTGYLRVVTNRRVFTDPTPLAHALEDCARMEASPAAQRIAAGPRHWEIFVALCRASSATANDVPDAYLAALAIERNATFVTHDRGFARFAGLRWSTPLV